MRLKRFIKKYFDKGNCCVTGLRGTGKDTLFANVTARRKKPYISNVDYQNKNVYIPLNLQAWDIQNNFENFISGDIVPYEYPYPDKWDYYVSDCGVYFPAQNFEKIQRKYPNISGFQALSRHLGDCNVHINAQNLNRVWDKIREQSDTYIMCEKCFYVPRLVFRHKPKWIIQVVTTYDKYESCINRVKPFKSIRLPLFNKNGQREIIRAKNEELKRAFEEKNGTVKRILLIYKNKSKYDTRLFKSLLKGGVKSE